MNAAARDAFPRVLAVIAALALAVSVRSQGLTQTQSPFPSVRTIAGSGAAGVGDGDAQNATFSMPMGLAYARDGTLYIADPSAQRIRTVSPGGSVRTFAGRGTLHGFWAEGGYADGALSAARFDRPTAVAVAKNGDVYVADYGNHCIRKISQGSVTTYAGSPERPGGQYGTLAQTQFGDPMALAIDDAKNDLYVADAHWGVRVIHPDGSTAAVGNFQRPTGIGLARGPWGLSIFIADKDGIDVISDTHELNRHFHVMEEASLTGVPNDRTTQALRPIGHPFGIAALNDRAIVYTDPYSDTIRLLSTYLGRVRVLTGLDTESAAADGASYRDGLGQSARLFGPTGIVVHGGSIVFSDSGDRRIRQLSNFDTSEPVLPYWSPLKDFGVPGYRILYIGNSNVYWDASGSDSIEGRLQNRLHAEGVRAGGDAINVLPIWTGSDLSATLSFLKSAADLFNVAIVQLNYGNLQDTFHIPEDQLSGRADEWVPKLSELLRTLQTTLQAHNAKTLVVIQPTSHEVSPAEEFYTTYEYSRLTPSNQTLEQPLLRSLREAGVRYVDLYPAFERAARSTTTRALFMTADQHFSMYGRDLVASALYDELRAWQPWR